MSEWRIFSTLTWIFLALALVSFCVLMFIPAPHGRHVRRGWGPQISARLGRFLMEMPAVVVFSAAFFTGERWHGAVPLTLFALWQTHYGYRSFIFPFRMRGGKPMTLLIASFVALLVTGPYGYLNGRYLSHFGDYPLSWLTDPRFIIGVILFVMGFAVNLHADQVLMDL